MINYKSRKLTLLMLIAIFFIGGYIFLNIKLDNLNITLFSLKLRIPKIIAIVIAAFAIGSASLVFQSIINNRIVTPCLLGMNSLYTLIHTVIYFVVGSGSILALNKNLSFIVDLCIMAIIATFTYSYLFKKTKYNILYVLLIGTVLSSLFTSLQTSMIRVMDPNEYDTLLTSLVASFNKINGEIIIISIFILILVAWLLKKELAVLDVIALGKAQAINLGVDYDITIRKLLLGVTIYIAVATAMVGPISFLGLIVANLARQYLKTYRHRALIFASIFLGIIILASGQLLVEHVYNYSVPISIFVTIGGGLYFLYLLLTSRSI